jgi:hypothetical protein
VDQDVSGLAIGHIGVIAGSNEADETLIRRSMVFKRNILRLIEQL